RYRSHRPRPPRQNSGVAGDQTVKPMPCSKVSMKYSLLKILSMGFKFLRPLSNVISYKCTLNSNKERIIMPGQISRPVRTLGVLTGGGDVPGLNPAIKALVYRAEPMGIRVIGLRAGWQGITYLDRSRN